MSMAPGKREIYEGKYNDECSVDDFLSHMPEKGLCHKVISEDEDEDHVFWYPSAEDHVNNVNPTSKISASRRSVQEQIKCFLEKVTVSSKDKHMMVQFWVPKSISGRTVLTVSEQPFAMGRIYKGLCRYRYRCIHQEIDISSNEVGPIGRVFNEESTEFCLNIDSYSRKEFPMQNYAKYCGITTIFVFPILDFFGCTGVLELVIRTNRYYNLQIRGLMEILGQSTDLSYSYSWDYFKVSSNRYAMMKSVRSNHGIPLIQLWVPGCDTSGNTELFLQWASTDNYIDFEGDYTYFTEEFGTHSVKNGKGLVGKAYSQKKCCFFEDTSRFSISDNPHAHNTRSFNLTACFAIPLQSINPALHPLILEVFLPPQPNYDHGNLEALLKSILATVYEQLLRSGEVEDEKELNVEFSHSDDENFVYFCVSRVSRTRRTGAAIGNDEPEPSYKMTVKATHRGKTVMFPQCNNSGIEELHRELGKRFKLEVGRFGIKYKDEDGEWIVLSCNKDLRFHVDNLKASEQSTLILEINPIEEAEIGQCSNADAIENEGVSENDETASHEIEEGEITLEKINQHRGCTTQKEAAEKLGVSLSTLKRRCKDLGLKRWPFSKRKKVHGPYPSVRLKKTKAIQEAEFGKCSNADAIENEGVSENDETASHENEAAVVNSNPTATNGNVFATRNDEIGLCVTKNARNSVAAAANAVPMGDIGEAVSTRSNIIAVMATYKDDTIRFPLSCISGIEDLRKELDDSFQFGAEKFKIKYKYDGRWITLLRDTHLSFHIEDIKKSGRSTMELSFFPDP